MLLPLDPPSSRLLPSAFIPFPMADVPQTDVSRPSALPTAKLLQRQSQPTIDQNSNEYLDAIEEEWNKRVDVEIETLVDGMTDIVGLASVRAYLSHAYCC